MSKYDKIKVFVSSTLEELKNERAIVKDTIEDLCLQPVMFEDIGASSEPARIGCLTELSESNIYIGLFNKIYSTPTIEEYLEAKKSSNIKAILIYVGIDDSEKRDEKLNKFLNNISDQNKGHIYYKFNDVIDLRNRIKKNLRAEITRIFKNKEANELIKLQKSEIEHSKIIIDFEKKYELNYIKKKNRHFLQMKARINYNEEAGAWYLMKIFINENILKKNDLINKPPDRKTLRGHESSWYNEDYASWVLPYSPDFIANYFHPFYKVINGDPYLLIFEITKHLMNGTNKIRIEHNSMQGNDAFKNPIIIEDLKVIDI